MPPNNLDDVAGLIAKKGKAGIKLLETAGNSAADIAKQIAKHGDDYFEIAKKRIEELNVTNTTL